MQTDRLIVQPDKLIRIGRRRSGKKFSLNLFVLAVGLVLTLIGGFLTIFTTPKINQSQVLEQNVSSGFELPSIEFNKKNTERIYSFNLSLRSFSQKTVHVFADDCLKSMVVNAKVVDIKTLLPTDKIQYYKFENGYCNFNQGVDLNLSQYLQEGDNRVEIKVTNTDGMMALLLNSSIFDPIYLSSLVILHSGILVIIWIIFTKLGLGKWVFLALVLSFALKEYYLTYSEFFVRSHDLLGTGHWGYVEYLSKNWSLPRPTEGWAYYHPPLYYFLAGLVMASSKSLELINTQLWIVSLSLVLFLVFQIYGLLIIKRYIERPLFQLYASVLFLFWPATVMYASRINNDTLLYPLFAAGLYYVTIWWQNRKKRRNLRYLVLSAILASMAILTKSSGIILAIIIAIAVLVAIAEKLIKLNSNQSENLKISLIAKIKQFSGLFNRLFFAALLSILIISSALLINHKRVQEEQKIKPDYNALIGNVQGLNRDLLVSNLPHNYFYLDLNQFFERPYTAIWPGQIGRDFFWNNFIKTSVAGEFEWQQEERKALMQILSVMVLGLFIFYIVYLIGADNREYKNNWILMITILGIIGGQMYTRLKMPYSPIQDFRYAAPILIPLSIGVTRFFEKNYPIISLPIKFLLMVFLLIFVGLTVRFYSLG